jgi:hypothetical protein
VRARRVELGSRWRSSGIAVFCGLWLAAAPGASADTIGLGTDGSGLPGSQITLFVPSNGSDQTLRNFYQWDEGLPSPTLAWPEGSLPNLPDASLMSVGNETSGAPTRQTVPEPAAALLFGLVLLAFARGLRAARAAGSADRAPGVAQRRPGRTLE